jgi:hypothetical protein
MSAPVRQVGQFLGSVFAALLCAASAQSAVLIHEYALRGALTDSKNGPALVQNGGSITPNGYVFSANQGVSFSSSVLTPANYSVEFSFKLSNPAGLDKLLDFQSLTANAGLYQVNGALSFLPGGPGAPSDILADTTVHVALTRNSATNVVVGYVNGEQRFSFVDLSQWAVPIGVSPQFQFFIDDFTTSQLDASGGTLNYLRVFNGSLTSQEVTALFLAGPPSLVPEPSTVVLLALGLALVGFQTARFCRRA